MDQGKPQKNHYSPILANKRWCDSTSHYWCYEKDLHARRVVGRSKGKEQWGWKKRLYSHEVESALGVDLENKVAPIYEAVLHGAELDEPRAIIWAQFLRSQFVRTPTFIRYENFACAVHGIKSELPYDRVGCKECQDLECVLSRDWMLLVAHADDYFVRTDNPVHYTGFLEDPSSVLYYPLHPKVCFVASSMPQAWDHTRKAKTIHSLPAFQLEKGGAFLLNFHLAKASENSLIIHPSNRDSLSETMFTEVLGVYPQVPFDLHSFSQDSKEALLKSLRILMSGADQKRYSLYSPQEIAPLYLFGSAKD